MSFVSNKLLQNATHSDPRQPLTWRKKKKKNANNVALHCAQVQNSPHIRCNSRTPFNTSEVEERKYILTLRQKQRMLLFMSRSKLAKRISPPQDARKEVISGVAGRANSSDAVNRSSCNQPRYSPKVRNNHAQRFQTVTSVACVRRWPRVRACVRVAGRMHACVRGELNCVCRVITSSTVGSVSVPGGPEFAAHTLAALAK